jgi:predicted ATPase
MDDGEELRSTRFEVRRELGQGGMGVVYEAYDHRLRSKVAIKRLKRIDGDALLGFKNEFRALADVEHPNLVRLGELYFEDGVWFFTMELVDGEDFLTYVRAGPETRPPPAPCFDEAKLRGALRQLASALAALHATGRVHRDVKPSNVLVEPSGRVVLLDFGLVDDMHAGLRPAPSYVSGGTPAYMAPEHALGGTIGPAADWYALGVMLYRALTGTHPHEGPADTLLYRKVTEEVDPPSRRRAGIPLDLEALCVDLLAREPERRPTGAEVLIRLGALHPDDPRALEVDPTMPEFVGRARELEVLGRALERTRRGAPAAVVVEGEPGEGKTALVGRFLYQAQTVDPDLLVLRGRCYEQESLPFRAVDSVVDALSLHLDALPPEELEPLLECGVEALPMLFPVLLRIPSIRLRSPKERAQRLSPERRAQAFDELRTILVRIAERGSLVLFIDDLQWADGDSLDLLEHLFAGEGAPACLFVATLRTTDRGMAAASSRVDAAMKDVVHIRLGGLSDAEASTLLARSLGHSAETEAVRDALVREAGGHPLFLAELGRWVMEHGIGALGRIRLDEVLWERVRALPPSARRILEVASLVGVPIRRDVLVEAAGVEGAHALRSLRQLAYLQMLRATRGGEYRMVEPYHDRVREAVVAHLDVSEDALARMHQRVGRSLLAHTPEAELDGQIFTVIRHLDLATPLLEPDERRNLARLLRRGARRAKDATAYEQALALVDRALVHVRALGGTGTKDERELLVEQMELTYLAGRTDDGRALYRALGAAARAPIDRADIDTRKVELDTVQGRFDEAIDTGLAALRQLGVPLPRKPGNASVLKEHAAVRWAQGSRPIATWARLPEMDDERLRAATGLLMALTPVTFFVDTVLLTVVLMRIARISLAHGVTKSSAYAFAGYGGVLSGAFHQYGEAFALGEAAEELNARFGNAQLEAKIGFLRGVYGTPWVRPFEQACLQLRAAVEAGRVHGDATYETYASACLALLTMCRGTSLAELTSECRSSLGIVRRRGDANMTTMVESFARFARRLAGDEPLELPPPEIDPVHVPVGAFYIHLMAAKEAFLFGDLDAAEAHLARTDPLTAVVFGVPGGVEHRFWHALVDAERHRRASPFARARLTARAKGHIRMFERWASSCPENFEPHRALLAAELERMRGGRQARARYDEAIAAACREACPEREAIARERLARHAIAEGASEAASLVGEAAEAYLRLGAHAKAAALDAERARLVS